MGKHIGRVFKSGNSYAIRVPMAWIEEHELQAGDTVRLGKSIRKVEDGDTDGRSYIPPADGTGQPEWD